MLIMSSRHAGRQGLPPTSRDPVALAVAVKVISTGDELLLLLLLAGSWAAPPAAVL